MSRVPRVFIIRHGETEWSKSGQHTSRTDLPLTEDGVRRVLATSQALVGTDKMIDPARIDKVFVSPRKRAHQTLELLFGDSLKSLDVDETADVREWEYGDYEGLKTADIQKLREAQGLSNPWVIWSDGCPNGESPQEISTRLDRVIDEICQRHHEAVREGRDGDIVVVAHGHSLRCFILRWLRREIDGNPSIIFDAGGVGVLSYEHRNIEERALYIGVAAGF